MIISNLKNSIRLGTCIRYLQDCKIGSIKKVHGKGLIADNLRHFFEELEKHNLKVTINSTTELSNFYKRIKSKPENYRLSDLEAKKLGLLAEKAKKHYSQNHSMSLTLF